MSGLQTLLATPLVARKPSDGDYSPHLLAYWPCNEGGGGVLYDHSGNNLHLRHGGTPSANLWDVAGRLNLNGSTDYFTAPLRGAGRHTLLSPLRLGPAYTATTISVSLTGGHAFLDSANGFGALDVAVGDYVEVSGCTTSGNNVIFRVNEYAAGRMATHGYDDFGVYLGAADAAGATVTMRKVLPMSFILSAFVKTTDTSAGIFWGRHQGAGTPQGWSFKINGSGHSECAMATYEAAQNSACATACNDGQEHHLALVLDAYSPRRIMMFLDGTLVNTVDSWIHGWRFTNPAGLTNPAFIVGATSHASLGEFFAGEMWNLQIYAQRKKQVWPTSGVVPKVSSAWVQKLATGAVLTRGDMP